MLRGVNNVKDDNPYLISSNLGDEIVDQLVYGNRLIISKIHRIYLLRYGSIEVIFVGM